MQQKQKATNRKQTERDKQNLRAILSPGTYNENGNIQALAACFSIGW